MGAKEIPRVSQAYDHVLLIGSCMLQLCMKDLRGCIVGVLEYHCVCLIEYFGCKVALFAEIISTEPFAQNGTM